MLPRVSALLLSAALSTACSSPAPAPDASAAGDASAAPDAPAPDASALDASALDASALDASAPPSDATDDTDSALAPDGSGPWRRDWTAHPAVYLATGARRLWALSDVHGDSDRLVALLQGAGLTSGGAASPTWLAGGDTLVVAGDSIDKGPQSIEVLDYWMALEPSVRAAGGHLVVLLGNHEADFLADPTNSMAAALDTELASRAVMPAVFASTADPHGRWLRERPVAAIVDGWFFSHAGQSGGRSAAQLDAEYRRVVDAEAWSDAFLSDANSILNARNWWPSSGTRAYLDANLAALPAQHIVFGHRPITFADPPSGEIEAHAAGRLVLVDVGMSRAVGYSTGRVLRIDAPGTASEAVAEVTPGGATSPIDLTAR